MRRRQRLLRQRNMGLYSGLSAEKTEIRIDPVESLYWNSRDKWTLRTSDAFSA